MESSIPVVELSANDALKFFLKGENYCRIELPHYISFDGLLQDCFDQSRSGLSSQCKSRPAEFENINHPLTTNKNGRYSWRPIEIIHPAVYVDLVKEITRPNNWKLIQQRFKDFTEDPKISCLSIPVNSETNRSDKAEQVFKWWREVEQKSIELSLEFDHVIHADISDCYSSMYTHSLSWAIHTKEIAKGQAFRRKKDELGNRIDKGLQDINWGQTNGIPQGSVFTDFVAEIVLGYMDSELSTRLSSAKLDEFQILRYRDDYRIFTKSRFQGEQILKVLVEMLSEYGFHLNPQKTVLRDSVISSSLKPDKIRWNAGRQWDRSIQKHLMIIHDFARQYPNSGSLRRSLSEFLKRIESTSRFDQPLPLVAIIVDIAYNHPTTYPLCAAILSKLLVSLEETGSRFNVVSKIIEKFKRQPNTGHMDIWIQRFCVGELEAFSFEEPVCKLVQGQRLGLWNSDWLDNGDLKSIVDRSRIVDRGELNAATEVIPYEEVALFPHYDA